MASNRWIHPNPGSMVNTWVTLFLLLVLVSNSHAQNVVRDFRTHENAPAELRDVHFESQVLAGVWHFAWSTPRSTSIVFDGNDTQSFEKSDRFVLLVASKSWDSKIAQIAIRPDGSYRQELMQCDARGILVVQSDLQLPGLAIKSEVRSDRLEIRGSIPLASLSMLTADGAPIRESDVVRVGLLRAKGSSAITAKPTSTTTRNTSIHWASWKTIPEENATLFSTSCLGLFPLAPPTEPERIEVMEGRRARQMRWAAEKTRDEFRAYCQSSLMQSKSRAWFDQLQTFPTPALEPIAFEWNESDPKESSWMAASFFDQSLHVQFETIAIETPQSASSVLWEMTSESGQTVKCTVQSDTMLIEWSDSTYARKTQLVCSGAPQDPRSHEYSIVYPGTGDARDIQVYCDGKPLMLQVVSNDMLDLTTLASWCSKQKGNWKFKTSRSGRRLEYFRIISNLPTSIEIRSMSSDEPWVTWEELPADVRNDWVQHFVQKVDLEGMYLHESLLHYARGRMSSQ